MIRCRQAIVVEGRYDKNTLSQLVEAPIFVTNGFGIFRDPQTMALLRAVAQKRGLVVLTDADGAGLVIRNRLKGAIPKEFLLHAYVPDIYGKERRKAAPGKEGKLGVEGMKPEVLLAALKNAGAELSEDSAVAPQGEPLTKTDLFALGLSGRPESRAKRLALQRALRLPGNLSANALLTALNVLYDKDEFLNCYDRIIRTKSEEVL